MKKILCNLLSFLLLLCVWILLSNGINLNIIISGTIICGAILIITNVVLGFNYATAFSLPIIKLIKYIFYMIFSIYLSGIKATYMILTGNINPGFVKCKINDKISDKFLQNIIENSITLTPGTITLENNNKELTVLILHKTKSSKHDVLSGFEPYIIEMQNDLSANN